MIKLDIISGFLGSGKTTMIKKLMKVVSTWGEKLVLIENEFGKIGIDGDLVRKEGIEVYEISQGCICCTLKDDFMHSLIEIADKLKPDRILFEPSGIFVLTDALEILRVPEVASRFTVNSLTTIVDSVNFIKQNSKFGYFFENQIANVSTLVLSKAQLVTDEEIDKVITSLNQINSRATILAKNWDDLNGDDLRTILGESPDFRMDILHPWEGQGQPHMGQCDCEDHHHCTDGKCSCGGNHSHHHSNQCGCGDYHADHYDYGVHHSHRHSENGHGFETIGLVTSRVFLHAELEQLLKRIQAGHFGDIIRGKGFLKSPEGYLEFSYVGSDFTIHEFKGIREGKVSFIGETLKKDELAKSFE